jgi:hypothetical protein
MRRAVTTRPEKTADATNAAGENTSRNQPKLIRQQSRRLRLVQKSRAAFSTEHGSGSGWPMGAGG